EIRQCLRLDLVCAWDNRRPAEGDDLAQALDYAALAERIQAFAAQARFQLVETFAERLAALLMEEFGIAWLRLKVTKPGAVPAARGVGGEIERGCRGTRCCSGWAAIPTGRCICAPVWRRSTRCSTTCAARRCSRVCRWAFAAAPS